MVLADTARLHAARLHWLPENDDFAHDVTRVLNPLRDLLLQAHPPLEAVLGKRLEHPAVLQLPTRYPTATTLRKAGKGRILQTLEHHAPRMAERLRDDIWAALEPQTFVVPAEQTIGSIVSAQRRVRSRYGATERSSRSGSGSCFAPTLSSRSSSIRGQSRSRRGNHRLKNALWLSAFCSLQHPPSRTYYDRKRAEGKRHNAAIMCLARRRCDLLHKMLRTQTLYCFERGRLRRPPHAHRLTRST